MMTTATQELKIGDIIEVLTFEERKQIRRVRVHDLRERSDRYLITGVNMQGKFPKNYKLPLEPSRDLNRSDCTAWCFTDLDGEANE